MIASAPTKLREYFAEREPIYKLRSAHYLVEMITSLRDVWRGGTRVLDVGGGSGLIAQCVADNFGVSHLHSIDVVDRYLPTVTIPHSIYDGVRIPFETASFDAATMMNVLHHVEPAQREALMLEIRRVVGGGPIYIKDHLSSGRIDDARLTALDFLGNAPFGGLISATYLSKNDWDQLCARTGFRIDASISGNYRSGLMRSLFPNRLEVTMRLVPA